jgi:hypothetical protein
MVLIRALLLCAALAACSAPAAKHSTVHLARQSVGYSTAPYATTSMISGPNSYTCLISSSSTSGTGAICPQWVTPTSVSASPETIWELSLLGMKDQGDGAQRIDTIVVLDRTKAQCLIDDRIEQRWMHRHHFTIERGHLADCTTSGVGK